MIRTVASVLALSCTAAAVLAWDAPGHRAITALALDRFATDAPAWLKDPARREGVIWQSAEPDRWRGLRSNFLIHENAPDHFLDIEDLEHYGLTLDTIPPLRYQYVAAMAVARHEHPRGVTGTLRPHNPKMDQSGQQEWPGFLPHAIMEHFAKLTSQFKTVRILETLNDPARAAQLVMARDNVAVTMGLLSHFVGDAAQPLHTTRHFNGWVDEESKPWPDNPHGFTAARTFHAYIDGGVLKLHGLADPAALKDGAPAPPAFESGQEWPTTLNYIRRSFDKVRPLYELEKSGALKKDEGKAFIRERLQDAGAMLGAMYAAAWAASAPTQKDIDDLVRYDGFGKTEPEGAGKPAGSKPKPSE